MQIQRINVQTNKNNSYQKQNMMQKANNQPSFGMVDPGSSLGKAIESGSIFGKPNYDKIVEALEFINEHPSWTFMDKVANVTSGNKYDKAIRQARLFTILPTPENVSAKAVTYGNDGSYITLSEPRNWLGLGSAHKGKDYGVIRAAEVIKKLDRSILEYQKQYAKELEVYNGIQTKIEALKSRLGQGEDAKIQAEIDALPKMQKPQEKMEYILSEIEKSISDQEPTIIEIAKPEKRRGGIFGFLAKWNK